MRPQLTCEQLASIPKEDLKKLLSCYTTVYVTGYDRKFVDDAYAQAELLFNSSAKIKLHRPLIFQSGALHPSYRWWGYYVVDIPRAPKREYFTMDSVHSPSNDRTSLWAAKKEFPQLETALSSLYQYNENICGAEPSAERTLDLWAVTPYASSEAFGGDTNHFQYSLIYPAKGGQVLFRRGRKYLLHDSSQGALLLNKNTEFCFSPTKRKKIYLIQYNFEFRQ
jgi:hypothetical protein